MTPFVIFEKVFQIFSDFFRDFFKKFAFLQKKKALAYNSSCFQLKLFARAFDSAVHTTKGIYHKHSPATQRRRSYIPMIRLPVAYPASTLLNCFHECDLYFHSLLILLFATCDYAASATYHSKHPICCCDCYYFLSAKGTNSRFGLTNLNFNQ